MFTIPNHCRPIATALLSLILAACSNDASVPVPTTNASPLPTATRNISATEAALPETAAASRLTLKDAQLFVHELALSSDNPYVREAAFHDHDTDWSFNVDAHTFALELRQPIPQTCEGRFTQSREGYWSAQFTDGDMLNRQWIPATDAQLTIDRKRSLLIDMCARFEQDTNIKRLGAALVTSPIYELPFRAPAATGPSIQVTVTIDWVHLTFTADMPFGTGYRSYYGRFGYDKNRQWTAWPIRGALTIADTGINHDEWLVIPKN